MEAQTVKVKTVAISLILLIVLVFAASSKAHTGYTGHGQSTVHSGYNSILGAYYYEDIYISGTGWTQYGRHYHDYNTLYRLPGQSYWTVLHRHNNRQCPTHPV